MYKYCLASLAISDLIMTIFMGIEHLSTLSEEILIWVMQLLESSKKAL